MMSSVLLASQKLVARSFNYAIPWRYDSNAYNMANESPTKTIDINGRRWKEKIVKEITNIDALFVITDLENEDFELISKMGNLRSLYIFTANKIKDISFIEHLLNLRNFMICDSDICDLQPIRNLIMKQGIENALCDRLCNIAIINSKVKDLNAISEIDRFGEFIIYKSLVDEQDSTYKKILRNTYYI